MAKSQGRSVSLNTEIVLPDDVIIEILTWLPVKSLLKFKCVCRSWRALISSRRFIKAQLENSKSAPNLAREMLAIDSGIRSDKLKVCSVNSMLYESAPQVFDVSYPLDLGSCCMMVACCDGLLLLRSKKREMILWNPSTRTWKTLPHFDLKFNIPEFDLGYDKSSDDYKVVGFPDDPETIVIVYSLRNDEWKRIKDINGQAIPYGALANGKLYCFIEPLFIDDWENFEPEAELIYDWEILSLDLEKEEIEILQMPSFVKVTDRSSLAVSEGSLFLLCPHLSKTHADVWILDGCSVGNGNWTKVVTMPCCPDGGWTYGFRFHSNLLYVQKNNGLVIFSGQGVDFVVYDAKDGSFRYHHIRDIGQYGRGTSHTYFESLVSPLG
ncbi:F-box/kelch-repeat protein At3g23880-like [Salvia miltiorrhiza]|uniref:F-box/kelch-repeat protein At3g23880-like n=1 Tax=Salvia miltiorrhiza TaxID=226208 RepID=UPI0025AD5F62|nr:F-box/kelch-repeat protein At3g23880-like [Salvia miltiorrhiza]